MGGRGIDRYCQSVAATNPRTDGQRMHAVGIRKFSSGSVLPNFAFFPHLLAPGIFAGQTSGGQNRAFSHLLELEVVLIFVLFPHFDAFRGISHCRTFYTAPRVFAVGKFRNFGIGGGGHTEGWAPGRGSASGPAGRSWPCTCCGGGRDGGGVKGRPRKGGLAPPPLPPTAPVPSPRGAHTLLAR